jgi:hypothetical protein
MTTGMIRSRVRRDQSQLAPPAQQKYRIDRTARERVVVCRISGTQRLREDGRALGDAGVSAVHRRAASRGCRAQSITRGRRRTMCCETRYRGSEGSSARNKGMALFPRKIGGRYAMIARQDNENLYLIYSDDLHCWNRGEVILKPLFPREFVQIGNCGSPLELEEGWLLLTLRPSVSIRTSRNCLCDMRCATWLKYIPATHRRHRRRYRRRKSVSALRHRSVAGRSTRGLPDDIGPPQGTLAADRLGGLADQAHCTAQRDFNQPRVHDTLHHRDRVQEPSVTGEFESADGPCEARRPNIPRRHLSRTWSAARRTRTPPGQIRRRCDRDIS